MVNQLSGSIKKIFRKQEKEYHKKNLSLSFAGTSQKVDYRGKMRMGMPHLYGEATYPDGTVYKGRWKSGLFHGEGTLLVNKTQTVFKGIFCNGGYLVSGRKTPLIKCQLEHVDITCHAFYKISESQKKLFLSVENQLTGCQLVKNQELKLDYLGHKERVKYSGTMHEGKPHGYGRCKYENGTEYIGNWKNGLFDGQGVLKNQDYIGDIFKGKFQEAGYAILDEKSPHSEVDYSEQKGVCLGAFYYKKSRLTKVMLNSGIFRVKDVL